MSGAPDELADYRAPAARALVLMHEVQLREFIDTWRRARDGGLVLPEVEDPDYASLDRLLLHMVGAARFYVTWTCERLGLDAPTIDAPPEVFADDATLDAYVDVLLAAWRAALATADPRSMEAESWTAPWGAPFTADAMLEHAVLHPMRHAFQLEELMARAR